jgi:hypothetical protein
MTGKIIDNKRIIREYIEKKVNTGNVNIIPEYILEDYKEISKVKNAPVQKKLTKKKTKK